MNWWPHWFLAVLMIFICFLLIIVVLLQRGRGGGLAGAFGGAGGSSAFGAKTGDVLTWITVGIAGVFLMLNVALNFAFDKSPIELPAPTVTTGIGTPITVPGPDGQPITVTPIEIQPATEGGAADSKASGTEGQKPAVSPDGAPPSGSDKPGTDPAPESTSKDPPSP